MVKTDSLAGPELNPRRPFFKGSGLKRSGSEYPVRKTVTEEVIADPKLLKEEKEKKYLKGILSFSGPFAQAALSRERVVSCFSSHQ